MVDGRSFRLADEVSYIQRRAAEHDSRIVSIGQVVLFSSESGDAWMLDLSEHLSVRLASDGQPELARVGATGAGSGGNAFRFLARARAKISNMFG